MIYCMAVLLILAKKVYPLDIIQHESWSVNSELPQDEFDTQVQASEFLITQY